MPPQERQALTKAYLDKLCPVDEPPSTPSSCPSGMSSIPLGGGPSSPSGLRPARSSLKKPSLNCLDMQAFFGYQPYKYQAPIRKPSNLPEIEAALTRARTDGAQDWEAASLAFNAKTNTRHCEQQVSYHLDLFLKFRAEDGIHRSEAVVWKQLEGLLPGHKYIIPDFSCGLDGGHDELAIRGWIRAALPTFIQEDAITSVNCLMECKSILGGSIYAAVSQVPPLSRLLTSSITDV